MGKRVAVAAANWKMNLLRADADAFMTALAPVVAAAGNQAEVVVFAPFTLLPTVSDKAPAKVGVGGQDLYWKPKGAYTGEISVAMLKDVGCTHFLIGHSERRRRFGVPEDELLTELGAVFGDNDFTVNRKLLAGVEGGLIPCLCVGETLSERERGETDALIEIQLRRGLCGVSAETVAAMLIAYEPVWAIGTGQTCEAEEANRVCGVVRAAVATLYGAATAESVRVLYGGSMNEKNVADLVAREHIDGGLVGGASLEVAKFQPIIEACAKS